MRLKHALQIAESAHRDQTDLSGVPYIEHPKAVALMVAIETNANVASMRVALLHDVVEDSTWTVNQLIAEGLPIYDAQAVEAITRRKGEVYMEYIGRVGQNLMARKVKICDLKHNLSPARALPDEARNESLRKRHERALKVLIAEEVMREW